MKQKTFVKTVLLTCVLLAMCAGNVLAEPATSDLSAEISRIAQALGTNGYYYYCAKYNKVYLVSFNNNKISYQEFSIRNNYASYGSSWSDDIDPFYYEIENNKVVSIIYQDTKMVITDITNSNQIPRFLNNAAASKIRSICGNYRDDNHKQNISLSESDGKFILTITKDDGTKIEDILDKLDYSGAGGKLYSLFFQYSSVDLINIKEATEQDFEYTSEYDFPLPYEAVPHFMEPSKITATSTLIEKNKDKNYYGAVNLSDNSWKSWCEGVDGDGIGEKVTFEFEKPIPLENICFRNGYGDLRFYFVNNRVKKISLYINDKYYKDFTLKDMWNWQELSIYKKNVSKVDIVIKEVYSGTKYKDTCISEIYFQRDFANDYEVPTFTLDARTTECLEKFPYQIYNTRKGLPESLFYTNDGIPVLLYFSNPTSNWDIYIFNDLDFYVFNPNNKTWNKENDNPIFASIKKQSDIAKRNNKPKALSFETNDDSWFYITECGEYDFDGFKFYEHVEEPVYYANER